jgi:predicted Fe-Mo cluster-binding NifX family protein
MNARNILSALVLSQATLSSAFAADPHIAVAAEGAQANAAVSKQAARASHILIFDAQGKLVSAQTNPAAKLSGGAGPALARWLAEHKVSVLVAGQVGGKMEDEMKRLGIRIASGSGPADNAAKAAK